MSGAPIMKLRDGEQVFWDATFADVLRAGLSQCPTPLGAVAIAADTADEAVRLRRDIAERGQKAGGA